MSYNDDMKKLPWQLRRLEILKRDGKCVNQYCEGKSQNLEVHHVDYIPGFQIWDYPADMLKTVCSVCHGKEQERYGAEKFLINTMKMKGFWINDILAMSCKFDTDTEFTEWFLHLLRKQQNG